MREGESAPHAPLRASGCARERGVTFTPPKGSVRTVSGMANIAIKDRALSSLSEHD
jgi:hypothetical protein